MLEIEITETMAIENLDTLAVYGSEINRYSTRLCVDDFERDIPQYRFSRRCR